MDAAESDEDFRMILSMDEVVGLLLESGYSRKAVCDINRSDFSEVRSALLDYHCMLKVKSAMDQFCEGLQELHIHDMIKQYPELMKSFFTSTFTVVNAGLL